jgi:hypothetical protein
MQKLKRMYRLPALAALLIGLFSFTGNFGGDVFKIYIGGKMVLEQYVAAKENTKSVYLSKSNLNETLDIYYSHCGHVGTNRHIAVKDRQGRVVKTWNFPDAAGANVAMSCRVRDIVGQQNSNTIALYYSSKELPEGKLLATVLVKGDAVTTR